jgi:hypothetical protein
MTAFLTPFGVLWGVFSQNLTAFSKRPSGCHVLDYQGFDCPNIFGFFWVRLLPQSVKKHLPSSFFARPHTSHLRVFAGLFAPAKHVCEPEVKRMQNNDLEQQIAALPFEIHEGAEGAVAKLFQ